MLARVFWVVCCVICLNISNALAANEPYAGAIVRKDNSFTPNADFSPNNLTDIMPNVDKNEGEQEIYFSADEMETEENNNIIIAKGNVVVTRGKMELTSDRLWYDQKKDILVSEGNVVVKEEDGSVLYTDKITLSQKMKRAEVDKVKVIMKDESRIWADRFVKKVSNNKQLRKASYTACDMCEGKSPLWQIDARKITHDAKGQNINYNDAVVRVKNIPVFYLPFLSHPAPEVKRRSGLLMTSMGSSSYLGQYLRPTYFWDVSDHTDVILSPYFTTDKGVVLGGQYRQYFYNGHISAEGTYLEDDGEYKDKKYSKFNRPSKRGNLFLDARYELNDLNEKLIEQAKHMDDLVQEVTKLATILQETQKTREEHGKKIDSLEVQVTQLNATMNTLKWVITLSVALFGGVIVFLITNLIQLIH